MLNFKPLFLAGVIAVALSGQTASAQWNAPYRGYNNSNYNAYYPQAYQQYNNHPNYNSGYSANNRQNYGASAYTPRYNYAPNYTSSYYQNPYYRSPYAARPGYPQYYRKKNNSSVFKKGPFTGNSDFMEDLWPGDDSIYEDVLPVHGPWDRNWGRAPWNRDYDDLWDEGGPEKWFDPSDPEEGLAWMWEDMLYTPNALGTMPGGWEAPSISVPNPVDVGDELRNATTDMPGEMRDFSEGFTYGDESYTGGKPNKDSGTFGLGKKKKDGISISPKQRK